MNTQGAVDKQPIMVNIKNVAKAICKRLTTVLRYNIEDPNIQHKTVDLIEWLIKSYSNENDIVLDICMGIGSTGKAAKNLNRNFIGIELDDDYFKLANEFIYQE